MKYFFLAFGIMLLLGLLCAPQASAYPDAFGNVQSTSGALFLRNTTLKNQSTPTTYAGTARLFSKTGTVSFVNANGLRLSVGGTITSTTWSCTQGDLTLNLAAAVGEPAFWVCNASNAWLRGPVIPSQ